MSIYGMYGFHDNLTIATSSFTEYIFNLRSLQGFSFSVVGVGVFFLPEDS